LGVPASLSSKNVAARPATDVQRSTARRMSDEAIAAWHSGSALTRATAIAIAIAAVLSIAFGRIPTASGLAILALIPAALIDVRQRRIPNTWVGLSGAVFVFSTALSALTGHDTKVVSIVAGALTLALPLLALHLISPNAMGFGDVKAAVVLGAALGAIDWQLSLAGLALAAGIAATVGTLSGARTIAFGPFLVIGTTVALAANPIFLSVITDGRVA